MTSEDIDYKGFAASLKKRKAELDVELRAVDAALRAIAVLPAPGDRGRSATPYKGLKPKAAAKLYLQNATERQSTREILTGLLEGGFTTKSENAYSILYTALRRMKDEPGSGMNQDDDGKWGIKK